MSAQDDFYRSRRKARSSETRAARKAGGRHPRRHKGSSKPRRSSYLDDPAYVTRPKTLRDINRDASTSANLRYGGQEQALGLVTRQTPAWFEQYKGQVAGINQGIQHGYQQAISDVGARVQATQQANDQSRQQLLAQQQADAASRGASVDASVYVNDANAATVNRQGENDFASLLAASQQAQGGYFGGIQTAAGAAQIAQQQQNADNMKALQGEKGQYRSQYVTDASQTEHKNRLEDAAFGLDQYKAQSTAATNRSRIRSTNRNAAAQRKQSSRNEKNSVITSGPFAGLTHQQVRELTPAQKTKRVRQHDKTKTNTAGAKDKTNARARLKDINSRIDNYKTLPFTPKQFDKATQKWVPGKTRNPTRAEIVQRLLKEGSGKGGKFTMVEINKVLARRDRAMKRAARRKTYSKGDGRPD